MTKPTDEPDVQWTLLVCMPECSGAHASIVRELRDHDIDIVGRRFTLTLDQALVIVQQYARLRERATEPRLSTSSATEEGAEMMSSMSFLSSVKADPRHSRWTDNLSSRRPQWWHMQPLQRPTNSQAESGHLLANIIRLAQGHRTHQQPNPSVVPSAGQRGGHAPGKTPPLSHSAVQSQRKKEGDSGSVPSCPELPRQCPPRSATGVDATDTHDANSVSQSLQRSLSGAPPPSTSAVPEDCPQYEDVEMRNVDPEALKLAGSLLKSGTVLVLLLCAVNAIERLVCLAGPEDPLEARRVAPGSWSARYGVDETRMGVYTPSCPTDALVAVEAVFSDEHTYNTFTKSNIQLRPPVHSMNESQGESQAIGDAIAAPVTFAQILPALRAGIPAIHRASYYTGIPESNASAAVAAGSLAATVAVGLDALTSPEQAVAHSDGNMLSHLILSPDSPMLPSTVVQHPQHREKEV